MIDTFYSLLLHSDWKSSWRAICSVSETLNQQGYLKISSAEMFKKIVLKQLKKQTEYFVFGFLHVVRPKALQLRKLLQAEQRIGTVSASVPVMTNIV